MTKSRSMSAHDEQTGTRATHDFGASRLDDVDLAILADADNLRRLELALVEQRAEVTFVPPFALEYLERGHAALFRCAAADDLRLDVMTRMRNVAPFADCWSRRSRFDLQGV